MLKSKVIIIDTPSELRLIEKVRPELKDTPLILLSNNFNPQKLQGFESRGFRYFDEQITTADGRIMVEIIHRILWNWFIDEGGTDLSLIEGCSLGKAFAGSIEVLLNTVLRYMVGLKKLLNPNNEVYFTSDTEGIFLLVIEKLQKEIGFSMVIVEVAGNREDYLYGRQRLRLDCLGRKRDLSPLFNRGRYRDIFISIFLKLLRRGKINRKSILIVPAGKMEEYFDYVTKKANTLSLILPFTRKNVFNIFLKPDTISFFHFYSFSILNSNKKIDNMIAILKNNIRNQIKDIDAELLISVMDRHTFSYFQGAFSYYRNVLKELICLKPEAVLLSTDAYENHMLIAQAAKKLMITTALIPHGVYSWGYPEYKSGADKLFDYYFAFGKKDLLDYKDQGVEAVNMSISSFPYFSRFLPRTHRKNDIYQKALILPLDFNNICPSEQIGHCLDYIYSVIKLLKELNIETIGIKGREDYVFKLLDFHGKHLNILQEKIPLLSDGDAFSETIKNADIVIGPISTAIIEAGLLGIDYYIFYPGYCIREIPSLTQGIFKIANVSRSMEVLKNNIINKMPYQKNCSVEDLIDLDMVNSKEDLYLKFENALSKILINPDMDK